MTRVGDRGGWKDLGSASTIGGHWLWELSAIRTASCRPARSSSQELNKASIAFSDEDNSPLSRRIIHAFLPPLFLPPQPIAEPDIVPAMNASRYTFVLDIPPHFERDVLAGRSPALQIDVDATAMTQAGLGSGYAEQIIDTEIANYLSDTETIPLSLVNLVARIAFNPNVTTAWFSSVMSIINNVTMLAIIMSGAAVIREREHGTMDHLLIPLRRRTDELTLPSRCAGLPKSLAVDSRYYTATYQLLHQPTLIP